MKRPHYTKRISVLLLSLTVAFLFVYSFYKREILNIDNDISFNAYGDTIYREGVRYYFINWCIEHLDEIIGK